MAAATTYQLIGPTTGSAGIPVQFVPVALGTVASAVSVRVHPTGGISYSTVVMQANGSTGAATFNYASAGTYNLSLSNDSGLTDPSAPSIVISNLPSSPSPSGVPSNF